MWHADCVRFVPPKVSVGGMHPVSQMQRREISNVNQSLSALGNVFAKLATAKKKLDKKAGSKVVGVVRVSFWETTFCDLWYMTRTGRTLAL